MQAEKPREKEDIPATTKHWRPQPHPHVPLISCCSSTLPPKLCRPPSGKIPGPPSHFNLNASDPEPVQELTSGFETLHSVQFRRISLTFFPSFGSAVSLSLLCTLTVSLSQPSAHTKQISFLPPTHPAPGLSSVCVSVCVCMKKIFT